MRIIDLQKKYRDTPASDLDLLLAAAIKKEKEFVYSHPEYPISIIHYLRFRWFIHLYKKGYSVAAITKHKEFYGLDFFVNKNVLIPRPDTELMVAEATKIMNYELRIKNDKTILIDVGTGSGCIPIAIMKTLAHKNINTFAIDISGSALMVAKKNAKKHNVKISFLRGNLLEPIIPRLGGAGLKARGGLVRPSLASEPPPTHPYPAQAGITIITANLPYLTEQQFQSESSIQREPKNALVAKNNGLALYEELFKQITKFKIYNLKFIILLEIDPAQTDKISKLIKTYLPDTKIETKKDLAGLYRLVKIF